MAQTKQEWYDKIKTFFPNWFWQNEGSNKAHIMALALILATIQQDSSDAIDETFLTEAAGETLDAHGDERDIERADGELDAAYSLRVRNLSQPVTGDRLAAAVNAVLNNGEGQFIENFDYGFFDDADVNTALFYDEDSTVWLDGRKLDKWFTVIIPIQTAGVAATIRTNIITAIEKNKALGVTYDVLYRTA